MTISISLAKRAMRLVEKFPQKDNLALAQIFDLNSYKDASDLEKREIMRVSSRFRMDHERNMPFERHFRRPIRPYLEGKTVLDLGCFTGGRTVAWHKKYSIKKSFGVDVEQVFIDASRHCASDEGVDAEFEMGFGEALPFPEGKFDAVVSFDVFEHVRDVRKTMAECLRVLKSGGVLIVVFPPFYCPTEHHLSCVSWTPAIHWFFSKDTLFSAYREIIKERPDAEWYLPSNEKLRDWEALYTLNGIKVSSFSAIVKEQGWKTDEIDLPFWLATTRHVGNYKWRRKLWRLLGTVNKLPGVRELATDRICAILRKP
jgi:ubiquinone/menaquinone biosynthesis C-methylase UbiE